MTQRLAHWCHGCRTVIRSNDAKASYRFKVNMRCEFFFHLNCGLRWEKSGWPILPGAMQNMARRAGVFVECWPKEGPS